MTSEKQFFEYFFLKSLVLHHLPLPLHLLYVRRHLSFFSVVREQRVKSGEKAFILLGQPSKVGNQASS